MVGGDRYPDDGADGGTPVFRGAGITSRLGTCLLEGGARLERV